MEPKLVYGTASIGSNDLEAVEDSLNLLEYVYSCGITTLDTAGLYPPGKSGRAESIIARFIQAHPDVEVWTKTNVSPGYSGRGDLSRDKILASAQASYGRLGREIDIYFPHTPDIVTPVKDSVAAFVELKERGIYRHLGLSNYSVDQTRILCDACEQAGLALPVVAQWQYNPLCRHVEKDLIPFYQSRKIAFSAYSPLAGGFLTGKVTDGNIAKSRFDPTWMPAAKKLYVDAYDRPAFHDAFKVLRSEAQQYGISVPNASLRWLLYHSALKGGDSIILAATKLSQIQELLEELKDSGGPLPPSMIDAFDRAWDMVRDEPAVRHGLDS